MASVPATEIQTVQAHDLSEVADRLRAFADALAKVGPHNKERFGIVCAMSHPCPDHPDHNAASIAIGGQPERCFEAHVALSQSLLHLMHRSGMVEVIQFPANDAVSPDQAN